MSTNMEQTNIQLIDLPDELLLVIFKKLNNVTLLYSLMGINTQLNRITSDSVFTKTLTLVRHSSSGLIYPLVDKVLDRFCSQILPQIHSKINTLYLESVSMERILRIADYPNLHYLGLYNIDDKTAERIFSDQSPLFHIFNKKIQSLHITRTDDQKEPKQNSATLIFTNILNVFSNIRDLNYYLIIESNLQTLSFYDRAPTFFSSTLMELNIKVCSLDDILYLLDGCLPQLCALYVNVVCVPRASTVINQKELLPNLRCFSLTSKMEIYYYNKSIVPVLQRMPNLEKLALYICVDQEIFLDGNCLKKDIVSQLPQLHNFIFNIRSLIYTRHQTRLLSNEDIEQTLGDLGDNPVICYVDYFPKDESAQCHFYSCPYTLRYYHNITNSFQGGLFKCVREVSLFDERPFEREFFIRIAQSFPLMEKLCVINRTAQKEKLNKNSECLSVIEYHYLTELDLIDVNDDYIEQFLVHTNVCLPNNICLWTRYDSLERVTQKFTRDATRINSAKINCLQIDDEFPLSERFTTYFPHADISRC